MTIAIALLLLVLYAVERAHNRRLRSTLERAVLAEQFFLTSPAPILVLNPTGSIQYINQAAAQLFGYATSEISGKPISLLISAASSNGHYHALEHALYSPAPSSSVCTITGRCRDQTTFPLQLRTKAIAHEGRRWAVMAVRDLTSDNQLKTALQRYVDQLLQSKEALQRYNADLEGLVRAQTDKLHIAKDAAEQANSAKSEFLANMSHELRTPLHGILSFARFGIKKHDLADRDKLLLYFQRIESAGQTLLKLLNALLDLSKLEARAMDLEYESVALGALISAVTEEFAAIARERELSIELSVSNPDVMIRADPEKLAQVVRNLLGNAVKFTPQGGKVQVTVSESSQTAVISVCDTGPGIPDEDCEREIGRASCRERV